MKKTILLFSFFLALIAVNAQTILFSDNFDSYTAGQQLCVQNSTDWTTWSISPGSAEDALISTEQALSPSNSLKIANSGSNDIIYRFANQTTGHYSVDMDIFIPSTGEGGYFNMQHYFTPGQQWAFECFFSNAGSGNFDVGGASIAFAHVVDDWAHITMDVNLDEDSASFTIDGFQIHKWLYHYTSDGTSGLNQLGSINLFAGAPDNGAGTYYVDNFVVTELTAANDGFIVIDPAGDIIKNASISEGADHTLLLSNGGGSPLDYRIISVYDIPEPDMNSYTTSYLYNFNIQAENFSGIFFSNSPEIQVATRIKSEDIQSHIGKQIRKVYVGIGKVDNLTANPEIIFYSMGNLIDVGPGSNVIYSQSFTPTADGEVEIILDSPLLIDGSDIWLALKLYQASTTDTSLMAVPYTDTEAVPNPEGNYCKTGIAWQHLNDGSPTLTYNWYLYAEVDGGAVLPWMSHSAVTSGTLNASQAVQDDIHFGAVDITEAPTTRTGKIIVQTTDFETPNTEIDVEINFVTVSLDENNNIQVRSYPNPATSSFQIDAEQISHVEVYNELGQMVFSTDCQQNNLTINTESWKAGNYSVKVNSNAGLTVKKVMIIK